MENIVALDIVCLIHLLISREWMPMLLEILLLSFMCCFQDKFSSMNTPKNCVTCSLLICISSIRRLGNVCGRNCLFERWWNKDHLVLSISRDNLFDLNHVETLSSSTFIITKSVSMFLWERNKFGPKNQTCQLKLKFGT